MATSSTGFNCHPTQGGNTSIGTIGMNLGTSQNFGGTTPSVFNARVGPMSQITMLENQVMHLVALMGKLQTDLTKLWRERGEDIIKINGQAFFGLSDWRAYYASKFPLTTATPEPFQIYFVDFISLLV